MGEVYRLPAKAAAERMKTADPRAQEAVGRDWQNSYADFTAGLKRELMQIRDAKARQRALNEMRLILETYKHAHPQQDAHRRAKAQPQASAKLIAID
jgi:metallo-beta-lactamase family protein